MRSSPHAKYLMPLLLVPALLLLAGVYYFSRETTAAEWVKHTVEVRLAASHLLKTIVDAETGQRGYIATGDPQFLDPYERATREWEEQLEALRQLT